MIGNVLRRIKVFTILHQNFLHDPKQLSLFYHKNLRGLTRTVEFSVPPSDLGIWDLIRSDLNLSPLEDWCVGPSGKDISISLLDVFLFLPSVLESRLPVEVFFLIFDSVARPPPRRTFTVRERSSVTSHCAPRCRRSRRRPFRLLRLFLRIRGSSPYLQRSLWSPCLLRTSLWSPNPPPVDVRCRFRYHQSWPTDLQGLGTQLPYVTCPTSFLGSRVAPVTGSSYSVEGPRSRYYCRILPLGRPTSNCDPGLSSFSFSGVRRRTVLVDSKSHLTLSVVLWIQDDFWAYTWCTRP